MWLLTFFSVLAPSHLVLAVLQSCILSTFVLINEYKFEQGGAGKRISQIYLFRECCSRCRFQPCDYTSSSTLWSRFSPHSNSVNGHTHTHTHTRLTAPFPGLPRWAGTRKVKPIWILLKQETVSGSGISWAICKSAPCSRQTTKPAPHHSVFYRPDALPAAQPTVSKHWRQMLTGTCRQCGSWSVTGHNHRKVIGRGTICAAKNGGQRYETKSVTVTLLVA